MALNEFRHKILVHLDVNSSQLVTTMWQISHSHYGLSKFSSTTTSERDKELSYQMKQWTLKFTLVITIF